MSLAAWMVTAQWVDEAAVYRSSPTNVKQYVAVVACAAIPCRRKATSNFDQMKSVIGQANTDNLLTSDELRFPVGYDVRAGDKILLNGTEWFTMAGQPQVKTVIPRQVGFISVTTPPKIVSGAWSDV